MMAKLGVLLLRLGALSADPSRTVLPRMLIATLAYNGKDAPIPATNTERRPYRACCSGGIAFFSLASLSVALIGEYLLDIRPCILCLYQRIPYGVAALVAGAGVVLPISSAFRRLAIVLCGVVFAVGAGLAFYSVGVEEQWWVGVAGCEGTSLPVLSVDDLQASLASPAVLRACDEDVWRLFGLSLAAYNVAVQLVVAAACFVGLRWMVRNPRQELP